MQASLLVLGERGFGADPRAGSSPGLWHIARCLLPADSELSCETLQAALLVLGERDFGADPRSGSSPGLWHFPRCLL